MPTPFTPMRVLAHASAPHTMPVVEPSFITDATMDPSEPEQALPAPAARPAIDWAAHARRAAAAAGSGVGLTFGLLARRWKPVLASVVVVAFVGMARTSWPAWVSRVRAQLRAAGEHVSVFDRPGPATPAVAVAKPARSERAAGPRRGRLHVDSEPQGAKVIVDGKERGVTPLNVSDLAVGTHQVLLDAESGSVRHTVSVSADKTTQLNEAIYSGWLHVSSSIDLQLSDHSKGLRLDDSNQVLLPPGVHDLRFENRTYGFVESRNVEIRPGDTTSIAVEPPQSSLSVTATTPAEVFVLSLIHI